MNRIISVVKVLAGVGLTVVAVVVFESYIAKHNWRFQTYSLVGEVSQINVCPVASTKGTTPEEAKCTTKGISYFGVYDREYFVAKTQGTDFATESPSGSVKEYFLDSLREMEAYCDFNTLTLASSSGNSYDIDTLHEEANRAPKQVYRGSSIVAASDLGKKVAKWLTNELGENLHLYRQRDCVAVKYNRSNMAICSICPEESARFIRDKFKLPLHVRANYFRPNVIISGCKALEEKWWSHVRIGDVYFQVKAPDIRVIADGDSITFMPTFEEPETPKHVQKITNFNTSFTLGVNTLVVKPGEIRVGDPVFVSKYYGYAQENDKGAES